MLRYSYRMQPTIFWWNLTRFGEALGELMGAGNQVDSEHFINGEYDEDLKKKLTENAERIILAAGDEFKEEFIVEYKELMAKVKEYY